MHCTLTVLFLISCCPALSQGKAVSSSSCLRMSGTPEMNVEFKQTLSAATALEVQVRQEDGLQTTIQIKRIKPGVPTATLFCLGCPNTPNASHSLVQPQSQHPQHYHYPQTPEHAEYPQFPKAQR